MTGLWRRRDFALLWAGQSVGDAGTAISLVVLPLVAVAYLHLAPFEVGLLAALEWVPWLLIGLPAGVWVDRSFKRRLMIAADVVRALLLASVPLTAAFGALTAAQLFAVAFGTGLATVVFQVAYQAYLPVVVARDDLPEANAKMQGSQSGARLVGPGIGGLLTEALRAPYALLVDAASYVVSAVSLWLIRASEPEPGGARQEPVRTSVAIGARYVLRDPLLRTMTLAPAVANLFYGGFGAIEVLFLVRDVGLAPGSVGLLISLASVGALIGTLLARRLAAGLGSARAMWLTSAITVPVGLLIPLTGPGARVIFLVAGQLVLIAGILVYNVIIGSFRQAYCPPDLLGRVVASMRFVLYGTIPLGSLGAGLLADVIGIRAAVWTLLAGNLLSVVVLLLSPLRGLRDLPSHPPAGRADVAGPTAHT